MHMFDLQRRFMGGYGIVGGQVPLATGAAYALKYQGKPGVVACQVGDATTNIGPWYESLNLAKLYQLPVIFFIVNNGFGMGTAVNEGSSEPDLYKKGLSFRIHGERVDGADVLAVRDATRRLREKAEKDKEPAIMDVVSFRFRGDAVERILCELVGHGRVRELLRQIQHFLLIRLCSGWWHRVGCSGHGEERVLDCGKVELLGGSSGGNAWRGRA